MITRPLDLASKLRREPRNFDFLFLVNAGLIVLFFGLFGSRFVLAPGMAVELQLPEISNAAATRVPTTHSITVDRSGLILTDAGGVGLPELRVWLKTAAASVPEPSLLVIADTGVRTADQAAIADAAAAAGFKRLVWAALVTEPVTDGEAAPQ